jgi:hypothetical protein
MTWISLDVSFAAPAALIGDAFSMQTLFLARVQPRPSRSS